MLGAFAAWVFLWLASSHHALMGRFFPAVIVAVSGLRRRASFDPPLRVATRVPGASPGDPSQPLLPATLTPATLDAFILLEAPNVAVDGLYWRILATLEQVGNARSQESIRRIVAEGEDHQKAFQAIKEWLEPHDPAQYLRSPNPALPNNEPVHQRLQTAYREVLESLHAGYTQPSLAGAPDINRARDGMLTKLAAACTDVAVAGLLVRFDPIADPRFAPVDPP